MSGPKAIAVVPILGIPVTTALMIGGAAVLSAVIISRTISQSVSLNLKKQIKNKVQNKIKDADDFLKKISSKGFDKCEEYQDAVESVKNIITNFNSINENAYNTDDITCLNKLLNDIDKTETALNMEKQSFNSDLFGMRSGLFLKKAEIENKKQILLSDDFYLKAGLKPEVYNKLKSVARILIDRTVIPDLPAFEIEKINAETLKSIKILFDDADKRLYEIIKKIYKQAEELSAKEIEDTVTNLKTEPFKTIEELIKINNASMTPNPKEISILKKLDALMAESAFFKNFDEYLIIEKKYDGVRLEENRAKRLMLYDDLVLYCDGLVSAERKKQILIKDAESIKLQLQCFNTPRALNLIPEIEDFIKSPDGKKIDHIKKLAIDALKEDISCENNKSCGESIKSAFNELGYETSEDFETILIKNQKAQMKKPSLKNYHVEVVSNSANSMLQVEIVREVETENELKESSNSQNIRDIEAEHEFCEDYYEIIKKLNKKGIAFDEKMHKKPGEVKVKKVLAANIKKKHGKTNQLINEHKKNI